VGLGHPVDEHPPAAVEALVEVKLTTRVPVQCVQRGRGGAPRRGQHRGADDLQVAVYQVDFRVPAEIAQHFLHVRVRHAEAVYVRLRQRLELAAFKAPHQRVAFHR
jgi:hypothetical protein